MVLAPKAWSSPVELDTDSLGLSSRIGSGVGLAAGVDELPDEMPGLLLSGEDVSVVVADGPAFEVVSGLVTLVLYVVSLEVAAGAEPSPTPIIPFNSAGAAFENIWISAIVLINSSGVPTFSIPSKNLEGV